MDAEIISVGSELVTGQTVDTNAAWLSTQLTRLGVQIVRHVTVGDDAGRIQEAITGALSEVELVILTGGLGPTPDDVTRQAIAGAIGQPLEENTEALDQVRAFFNRLQRPMSESNKIQAMLPRGCALIRNRRGTAPGIWHQGKAVQLFALPGVPGEMKAMFDEAVRPAIESQPGRACVRWVRLLCCGRSEASIGELLDDLMEIGRNPSVGTTASLGVITVRVVARSREASEAKRLIDADFSEIRRRLGRAVFGQDDDTMQEVVGKLLLERGLTIATAESCTGGLVGKRLTDVPGSSAYFLRGYVTYSNEAKSDLLGVPPELIAAEGAVSEPVARAMATGCRAAAGADLALSITGIAGPGGGDPPHKPVGLVFIGLADLGGVDVQRLFLGDHLSRSEIRERSCTSALNLLRLRLIGPDAACTAR